MSELNSCNQIQIERHRTAIRRAGLSVPVQCLLRDGLLGDTRSLFDYGCGRGQDLDLLQGIGLTCSGWDPVYRPDAEQATADVVNLGYVINVIEDPAERADALRQAWALCGSLLVVSAQLTFSAPQREQTRFGDGVLTSRQTFQKYYTQSELSAYLEEVLGVGVIPAAPGIFYAFKDEVAKQTFLASRYRRAVTVPRLRVSELLFEQHRDLLDPFIERLTELGRLPGPEELAHFKEITQRLGSLKRAFMIVQRVTSQETWVEIAKSRSEDVLVYLALARFGRRPPLSKLPLVTQRDVKAFFGSYAEACKQADELLFTVSDAAAIDAACQRAEVGRLVENALIVHRSALERLEPLLRVYEGCARALVGEIEGANVVKIHRASGKVSYLCYRDFDADPHPSLNLRVKVALRSLETDFFDYSGRTDPFILYRKDALIHPDYPYHARFAALTRQEARIGLLGYETELTTKSKLESCLSASGLCLRGHRIVRRPEVSPGAS